MYNLDITLKEGRDKVRELFHNNSHIRDPRVIDMLVIKVCVCVSIDIVYLWCEHACNMSKILSRVSE